MAKQSRILVNKETPQEFAKREAGGKGYNLYLLTREGFPIPRWIILGVSAFRDFQNVTGIGRKIEQQIVMLKNSRSSPHALSKISASIREIILEAPLPTSLEQQIKAAYRSLRSGSIAIRSSAVDEDSPSQSFAGQLSSFLAVRSEHDALEAAKECWASAYSQRCLSYRIQNSLSIEPARINVAVIFQEMVESEKSGVLFTYDPVKRDESKIVVNAIFGIGEGLVSGALDADTYYMDKLTRKKIGEDIVVKNMQFVSAQRESGIKRVSVPEDLQQRAVLSDGDLDELARIAMRIEEFFGTPQDIEWAWSSRQFYILQSRPVTTFSDEDKELLQIWDNSNIIESYEGITLPLTFSFARFVYHEVYVQFCEILMVPRETVKNMDRFLRNMLGIFYGRIYYNMLNWYRLTSILPGFRYNRSFMETMMGTKHRLNDAISEEILKATNQRYLSRFRRFITGFKFLYYHFRIQGMVDKFLRYFNDVYEEYRRFDYEKMSAGEIFEKYHELEQKLLRYWKAPIINDYLCMVHFGLFRKLTDRWLSSLSALSHNDFFRGGGGMESTEPAHRLMKLAQEAHSSPELKHLFENIPPKDCMDALRTHGFHDFLGKINQYIDNYGYRCMNEMKLEEQDLTQDPTFLFICLKNYIQNSSFNARDQEDKERLVRDTAEKKARELLSFGKRIIYFRIFQYAQRAVRNRENMRLCRAKIYGVARRVFRGVGNDYVRHGIIETSDDIFYLELEEVIGALRGTLTIQNLRSLINLRKAEYERYKDIELPSRFVTLGPVYWMNDARRDESTAPQESKKGLLRGIGCCSGIIEGKVKVILSRSDDLVLKGEILVAKRTDPGWIPLYPSISGLLVERGGLLSHSAIVAREMGIPTVIGISDLLQHLRTGMRVKIDGAAGTVEIIGLD